MKTNPKFSLLFITGIILLIFSVFWFFHTPNRKFEKICDDLFVAELSRDGLSLHYTLANPESYGIDESNPSLPVYDRTQSIADYQAILSAIDALEEIDKDSLNSSNRQTYELLLDYLKTESSSFAYFYYDEPLSPTSGMHTHLPVLLAEYTFYDKEDVENYISLLQSVPAYLKGLGEFEKDKANEGLFMSADACTDVIAQCNTIITKEGLTEGTHFLQTSFQERLDELVEEGILSMEERNAYITANNSILSDAVLPAYKSLAHTLTTLQGSGNNENGLCYYPDGKEYYKILVGKMTGSSKDINEIMTRLQSSFLADYDAFLETVYLTKDSNNLSVFSISEPEKMLRDLEESISEDFPSYPGIKEDNIPSYEIKEVSESMEDYLSPAFYLTPPLDNISENVIYINYGTSPENLELYTTLAHEGYPGHLYQSVYSTLAWEENNVHPIRSLLHYGGYVEGYATYAELYSYEYATEFGNENYCELIRLNRKLHLALYSMLDISIHYYGATYEEAHETLAAFGIEDKKTTGEIYDYIVNSPGNYLQYYVGYLEIMECRELARVKWKDNYSDYHFHEFLLEFGPADFETIKDAIRDYDAPKAEEDVETMAIAFPSRFLQYDWCQDGLRQVQEIPLHRQWT